MSKMFCDSICELNYKRCEELGLNIINMPYIRNGVEKYYDLGRDKNVTLDFFNGMRAGDSVRTCALSPQNYIDIFEPIFASGEDIIYVHFSHKLTSTFEFMHSAVDELLAKYPGRKFYAVDTLSVCQGAGIVVYEAAKLHKSGASDEEVVAFAEKFTKTIVTTFVVEDLKYLKNTGRISPTTAFFGTLLNIKPIIHISPEGELEKKSKANGMNKAIDYLYNNFVEKFTEETLNHPIIILNADAEDSANILKNKITEKCGDKADIWFEIVGPAIGVHCGPGTVALIFAK